MFVHKESVYTLSRKTISLIAEPEDEKRLTFFIFIASVSFDFRWMLMVDR